MEKHVYGIIFDHLVNIDFLSDNQWGFRTKRSTGLALLLATNDWFDHLDKHKEVGAVFFDLKKAFDSVPHRALMETLQSLHLHPGVLNWVHQYLCSLPSLMCSSIIIPVERPTH